MTSVFETFKGVINQSADHFYVFTKNLNFLSNILLKSKKFTPSKYEKHPLTLLFI